MVYLRLLFNTLVVYLKSICKKGKWSLIFFQNIHPSVKIITNSKSKIIFGKNLIIERYGDIFVGKSATLKIGNHCYFNKDLTISCSEEVTIGDNCLFGPDVKIYDNNHKFYRNKGVSFEQIKAPIHIGNNCWIASNVVILKGVTIGDNCVVGAGCVVTKNVPDNCKVYQKNNVVIEELKEV